MHKPYFKYTKCPICGGYKSVTYDKEHQMFKEWCLTLKCPYELLRPDLRSGANKIDFPDRRNPLNNKEGGDIT